LILALLLALVVDHPVDGDTIKLRNVGYVRLLGIDAPETVKPGTPVQPCGPEASAALRGMLAGAYPATYAKVTLRYGPRRRDKYGRVLAYVYVSGRLLNRELIERGLAHAERAYPHRRMAEFIAAEDRAKAAHLGLWATAPCGGEQ
jgi:micrococcal nuclease